MMNYSDSNITALKMQPVDGNLLRNAAGLPQLSTFEVELGDVEIKTQRDPETGRVVYNAWVEGKQFECSSRFRNSMMGWIGQGTSVLNLFPFDEVVNRFIEVNPKKGDEIKVTVDRTSNKLLAAVSPDKFVPSVNGLMELLAEVGGQVMYDGNGQLLAMCQPAMESVFLVGKSEDEHHIRNSFIIPLDGYGSPSHFVGAMRIRCQNGQIAMHNVWQSTCSFGKKSDPLHAIDRFVRNTSNIEAETRFRERLEIASRTLASFDEVVSLNRLLRHRPSNDDAYAYSSSRFFNTVLADTLSVTEADAEGFSVKERSRIRSKVTVYDLINMATEASTHYGNVAPLSFVGKILDPATSFDLEGVTTQEFKELDSVINNNQSFWLNGVIKTDRDATRFVDLATLN